MTKKQRLVLKSYGIVAQKEVSLYESATKKAKQL